MLNGWMAEVRNNVHTGIQIDAWGKGRASIYSETVQIVFKSRCKYVHYPFLQTQLKPYCPHPTAVRHPMAVFTLLSHL